jgi:hypothetical protein
MSDGGEEATTEEAVGHWYTLLPCAADQHWAVPQNALAEIVTLPGDDEQPPEELAWRGVSVPVLDFGRDDGSSWRERVGGTGLVAVFLGLEGERCDYWGVALRGAGLTVKRIAAADIVDAPDAVVEHATAAFTLGNTTYQVPDLVALQRQIAATLDAA